MTVNGGGTDQDQRTEQFRQAVMHELMEQTRIAEKQSRFAESTRNMLSYLLVLILASVAAAILLTQI